MLLASSENNELHLVCDIKANKIGLIEQAANENVQEVSFALAPSLLVKPLQKNQIDIYSNQG